MTLTLCLFLMISSCYQDLSFFAAILWSFCWESAGWQEFIHAYIFTMAHKRSVLAAKKAVWGLQGRQSNKYKYMLAELTPWATGCFQIIDLDHWRNRTFLTYIGKADVSTRQYSTGLVLAVIPDNNFCRKWRSCSVDQISKNIFWSYLKG